MNSFGDYLKGLRNAKGVYLRDVGGVVGLSDGYISQMETGKRRDTLTIGKLIAFAEYYGVSKLEMCLAAIVDGCGCQCKMTSKTDKTCKDECKNVEKQMALPDIKEQIAIGLTAKCKKCKFHLFDRGEWVCKESPPTYDTEICKSKFPPVQDDWWCGKHDPL